MDYQTALSRCYAVADMNRLARGLSICDPRRLKRLANVSKRDSRKARAKGAWPLTRKDHK